MAKHTRLRLLLYAKFNGHAIADPPAGCAFVCFDDGLVQAKQSGHPVCRSVWAPGLVPKVNMSEFRAISVSDAQLPAGARIPLFAVLLSLVLILAQPWLWIKRLRAAGPDRAT